MNDISKTNIQTKLVKAMAAENIGPSETARIFGIPPTYISMMKNQQAWDKCPKSAWEAVLLWINSGQGLKEYSEKHGKVLPEKHESVLHHGTIPQSEAWHQEIAEQTGNPIQAQRDHEAHQLLKETEKMFYPEQTEPEVIKTPLGEEFEFRRSMMGSKPENQRIVIDIEINLIINGKKIEMK